MVTREIVIQKVILSRIIKILYYKVNIVIVSIKMAFMSKNNKILLMTI
jgi:hypothetical protein